MYSATLGTPSAVNAKQYQYPGSATPESPGTLTVKVLPSFADGVNAMRRWSVLTVCVVLERRIRAKSVTGASSVVVIVNELPTATLVALTLWIFGLVTREPSLLKR